MEIFTYLYPREWVAQVVVWVQVVGFVLWGTSLLYFFFRDLRLRRAIEKFDLSDLRLQSGENNAVDKKVSQTSSKSPRHPIPSSRALSRHLLTLDAFGKTGRSLDVEGLIRNTTSRLISNNAWLKSTLSLFIIVGLLGTLWGLASSLDQLSTMSAGGSQITNETLAQGLNTLLGKLGGAFAPSINGVAFTIIGVLMFALYTRAASMPLADSLERQTLTYWAPTLARKETDSRLLMSNNIKAAVQIGNAAESISTNVSKLVGTFDESLPALVSDLTRSIGQISEKLRSDATSLSDDLLHARSSLQALTGASENLNKFSERFRKSVEKLYPFSDAAELRALYEKLLDRSANILENHDAFQQLVLEQLAQITEQKELLNSGLSAFHESVNQVSNSIAGEIGGTSVAAKDAFLRLSEQNENVIREIVNQVGAPIVAILEPIPHTMGVLNQEIRRINTPLEGVKESIANSSFQVINYATERMGRIEDKLQAQVTNLEGLSSSVNNLVPKIEVLSERIDTFNTETEKFAKSIDNFSRKTVDVADKFERFEQKADEVIRATRVVPKPSLREPSTNRQPDFRTEPSSSLQLEKKGFFRSIKNKIFGK